MTVDTQDWMAEAVRLRREEQMETADIAARVDRSPSRVRRVLAEANAARFTEPAGPDRVLSTEEASEAFSEPQTTVYDHLPPSEEPAPEDDPEYEPEGIADQWFRAEAGEPVGPMQTRPGEEPPTQREMDGGEEVVPSPQIKGATQLALDFGPNAAMVTSATIVLKSEKLTSGYFEMGDVIHGSFTARITAITGAEKLDKDLDVFVAKPQAQVATITEITVV